MQTLVLKLQGFFISACEDAGYTLILLWQAISSVKFIHKRRKHIIDEMFVATYGSMPVVFIVAFFSGMILALQVGIELRRYGQESNIGTIVAASMFRETAPVMTAFALASLIGSAIASRLATMKVSEEIDALEVMDIDPVNYLVMPRLVALSIAGPILTIYSVVIGVLGGSIISLYVFNMNFDVYIESTKKVLMMRDVFSCVLKSTCFGMTMAIIACSQGLRAENGAQGVGSATLKSVVISLLFILMLDVFLTRLIY